MTLFLQKKTSLPLEGSIFLVVFPRCHDGESVSLGLLLSPGGNAF